MSSLGDLVVFPLRRKSFASQVLEVSKKLDKYYLGEELQGLLNDWTSRYSLPPQPVDATHALIPPILWRLAVYDNAESIGSKYL